jgi:hypothetical protein
MEMRVASGFGLSAACLSAALLAGCGEPDRTLEFGINGLTYPLVRN